jgi:pimeloyl-ACP methyl ester carboxylesterase/DNA-binding CsgD family transcriptional regulator
MVNARMARSLPRRGPSLPYGPFRPLDWQAMEQDIRFTELDGKRITYATMGEGPLLIVGGRWVSHLEEEWSHPRPRAFFEDLAATHRVVRYDRIGVGLSDRVMPAPASVDLDRRMLAAVHAAVGLEPATLFAYCRAGHAAASYASRDPELVRKIVFSGAYAARDDIPVVTRRSLIDFLRTNWALAAQMLAGLLMPHASGDDIAALSGHLRASADAEVAAEVLDLDLSTDIRPLLPAVTTPALVLHSRDDRAVPISRGRDLASLLPNARFVALTGGTHLPWTEDTRELQRALAGFLRDQPEAEPNGNSPLTSRETEVLRLVASGLSNREIAYSLVLSEHTVHRHVANILRKLAQSTRAAAAAHATRAGLI